MKGAPIQWDRCPRIPPSHCSAFHRRRRCAGPGGGAADVTVTVTVPSRDCPVGRYGNGLPSSTVLPGTVSSSRCRGACSRDSSVPSGQPPELARKCPPTCGSRGCSWSARRVGDGNLVKVFHPFTDVLRGVDVP